MTPYKKSAPQGLSYPPLDTRTPPARRPSLAHTPLHHPTPKVARNSATRKINTAHKRCNTNGLVSKFERFTWNYVRHFRATTPNGARTRPHTPTRQHVNTSTHANTAPHHRTPERPPPRPGLVTRERPPDAPASPTPRPGLVPDDRPHPTQASRPT